MIAGHSFEDYRDAFARYHAGWKLDLMVVEPEELPEVVRDNVPEPDNLVAFHFSSWVEDLEEEVSMWIPVKKDELEDRLEPESMAKMSKSLLDECLVRAIDHRRELRKGGDNGDVGAHNPG